MLAGLIGTSANVGIVLMSAVGMARDITPESWRWVLLAGDVLVSILLVSSDGKRLRHGAARAAPLPQPALLGRGRLYRR